MRNFTILILLLTANLCRRDIILSTLTLPFGHYHLDSNHRWMPIVQD